MTLTISLYAQTIPDRFLGNEKSVVTPNVIVDGTAADLIEGGATRGSNLFHSFSEFNVGNGNAVYFASPDGIANILTRVTGNNGSDIFGTLEVNGAANSFLFNPNRIVFGDLKLSNKALLDTSGVLTGDINLQGKNISLEDASAVVIQNLGKEQFGNITVRATNSTNLSGTVRNSPNITTPAGNITGVVSSQFTTETLGMGKSGNILIESNIYLLMTAVLFTPAVIVVQIREISTWRLPISFRLTAFRHSILVLVI